MLRSKLFQTALPVAAIGTALLSAAPASAQVVNGGFDSCTTTGYSASGNTGASAGIGGFLVASGCFGYVQTGTVGVYSTLTQAITLAAGDTVSGLVGYSTMESASSTYNDNAYLSINGTSLFAANTLSPLNGISPRSTGFVSFAFTALTAGSYSLQLGVRNVGDSTVSSYAVIDNVAVAAAAVVPEPATWAMMIGGIGAAGGALRRRKANVSVRFA